MAATVVAQNYMLDQLSDAAMLPHNRQASSRLVRRKRQVLVAMIVLGAPAIMLPPPPLGKYLWVAVLVAGGLLMGIIEIKRVLLFKRDRLERRAAHPHSSPE